MHAIIEAGGKQYRVQKGDIIYVEKLPQNAGDKFIFDKVLAVIDGDKFKAGTPTVDGCTVEGKVVKSARAKKIIVYKMHAKKNYRRKQGHRQPYTKVEILSVSV